MGELNVTSLYITLREGPNRLIIDGSLQLFGKLLETMGKSLTLQESENHKPNNDTPNNRPAQEVQHAQAS